MSLIPAWDVDLGAGLRHPEFSDMRDVCAVVTKVPMPVPRPQGPASTEESPTRRWLQGHHATNAPSASYRVEPAPQPPEGCLDGRLAPLRSVTGVCAARTTDGIRS